MSDDDNQIVIERLKALHAGDGGELSEEASFYCPVCGIKPLVFTGNRAWNDGMPVVECLCLAPFSPRAAFADVWLWSFFMLRSAESWGLFVQWKQSLPEPEES
jgi:hypothetical protein